MQNNLPMHVGIIMDGNGRWATKRGLKRSLGHKKGSENLEKLIEHIFKLGIPYVSVYAFSTENFKRSAEEVDYLMNLFIKMFTLKKKIFVKKGIRVIFSGRKSNLRKDVLDSMEQLTFATKNLTKGTFNICLNYGGRCEIVDMTKRILLDYKEGKITLASINEELLDQYMYQNLPPLDMIIRTSGEMRISNFMLWQSSYAEYFFPEVLFPDFNSYEFDKILEEYQNRHRRFGGL